MEYKEKAFEIHKQALPPSHQSIGACFNNIGYANIKLRRFPEAKECFEKCQQTEFDKGRVFRNWSMYHALQDNTSEALEALQKAVDNGYDDLEWITTDDSLDSIRNEPAYHQIVEQLQQRKAAEE